MGRDGAKNIAWRLCGTISMVPGEQQPRLRLADQKTAASAPCPRARPRCVAARSRTSSAAACRRKRGAPRAAPPPRRQSPPRGRSARSIDGGGRGRGRGGRAGGECEQQRDVAAHAGRGLAGGRRSQGALAGAATPRSIGAPRGTGGARAGGQGTVVFRRRQVEEVKAAPAGGGAPVLRERSRLVVEHVDLIGPAFWAQHSHLMPQAAAPAPTNAAGGAADAALSAGRDAARE